MDIMPVAVDLVPARLLDEGGMDSAFAQAMKCFHRLRVHPVFDKWIQTPVLSDPVASLQLP